MKSLSLLGILLVVLGALALAYQGINYTQHEDVLDVGPIHATADRQEQIPLPPILGGLALLGGWLSWSPAPGKKFRRKFRLGTNRELYAIRASPAKGVV